jgi:hypothetical protein
MVVTDRKNISKEIHFKSNYCYIIAINFYEKTYLLLLKRIVNYYLGSVQRQLPGSNKKFSTKKNPLYRSSIVTKNISFLKNPLVTKKNFFYEFQYPSYLLRKLLRKNPL